MTDATIIDQGLIAFCGRAKADGASRLVLRHASQGGQGAIVLERGTTAIEADELAVALYEAAAHDAAGLGGLQKYAIQSYAPAASRASGRYILRVRGDDDADELEASEPPTSAGITSQLMRHCEASFRVTVHTGREMLEILQRENASLRERIDAHEARSVETWRLLEEMHSARDERATAKQLAGEQVRRESETWDTVKLLAPMVAKKLLGVEVPGSLSPVEVQVDELMSSLTKPQVERLMQILTPAQLATIAELHQAAQKRREAKPAEGDSAPRNGNGQSTT